MPWYSSSRIARKTAASQFILCPKVSRVALVHWALIGASGFFTAQSVVYIRLYQISVLKPTLKTTQFSLNTAISFYNCKLSPYSHLKHTLNTLKERAHFATVLSIAFQVAFLPSGAFPVHRLCSLERWHTRMWEVDLSGLQAVRTSQHR